MDIAKSEWSKASNGVVRDSRGYLWRVIGFIDRPAVLLDPLVIEGEEETAKRERQTIIMGSPISNDYTLLLPSPPEGEAR